MHNAICFEMSTYGSFVDNARKASERLQNGKHFDNHIMWWIQVKVYAINCYIPLEQNRLFNHEQSSELKSVQHSEKTEFLLVSEANILP